LLFQNLRGGESQAGHTTPHITQTGSMLKSVKRTFDDISDKPPQCSPMRISFLDTTPIKRARTEDAFNSPVNTTRKHLREEDSPFSPATPFQPGKFKKTSGYHLHQSQKF